MIHQQAYLDTKVGKEVNGGLKMQKITKADTQMINKYIKKLRYLGVRYLSKHAWRDSNPQLSVPKTDALSN